MTKELTRNSNHELMRIVSMFLIVFWHTILHGNVLNNCVNEGLTQILYFIQFVVIIHVNSFILLTGYYQCKKKFKQSSLWKIINSTLFYKISIMIILSLLGLISVNKVTILKEIFPINMTQYWFIKCYFLLYCISPFLNKLINSMNKKEFKTLVIVGFIIMSVLPIMTNNGAFSNNGYSLYSFIYLYFIGAYLRNYPIEKSHMFKRLSKNYFIIIMIFIFFSCAFIKYLLFVYGKNIVGINSVFDELSNFIMNASSSYNAPLIVIQSIAYFSIFTMITLKSKFINKVSSLVFGVYLLSDNGYIRTFLYKWLKIDNGAIYSYKFLIYVFLMVVSIYIVCLIIEYIRQLIFKFIYNRKISKRIRDKYYSWCNSIYIKG